jgi:hypothetical protein
MRFVAMTLALVATPTFPRPLQADDPPKRSPELKVLDRFIGDWDDAIINKTTGQKYDATESRKWSRGGDFVLSDDKNLATKKEAHFLITYDPNAGVYRACFIEEASAALLLGAWDEKAQTMKWTGPPEVSVRYSGSHRFVDKDLAIWSIKVTGQDGTVYAEMSGKQTRRK